MGTGAGKHPVQVALIGAGSRGSAYASWIEAHPERGHLVALAEPREGVRRTLADRHGILPGKQFEDWRDLAADRHADLAIVAVQDAQHAAVACALAAAGYDVLVEKPLAPTLEECRRVVDACQDAGVLLGVCHVLRYTPLTRTLKALLAEGRIGDLMSVEHLEPVGYWHQAHAFVRGHWRNESQSSPMLLSKSCHDLDWLRHIVERPVRSVASYGRLSHFRRENRPEGAADRCVDCAVEASCPYAATRIYGRFLAAGDHGWPLDTVVAEPTPAALREALTDGPYGRCVYCCDNDVVDHQVVALDFEGGATATFTMTGFSRHRGRQTRLFGTRGEVFTDGTRVEIYDFLTDETEEVPLLETDNGAGGGHGGGDGGLMASFLHAVARRDPALVETGGEDALRSHELVFAAETARREDRVVSMREFATQ